MLNFGNIFSPFLLDSKDAFMQEVNKRLLNLKESGSTLYTVECHEPLFSKSELQQLKIILSECCTVEHEVLKEVGHYKDKLPAKKRIKTLANLLSKIKKELT